MTTSTRRSLTQIFLPPAMIALIVAFGLVAALLGNGIWDTASWIALAFPLALVAFFLCKRAQ